MSEEKAKYSCSTTVDISKFINAKIHTIYRCSICGKHSDKPYDYCPHCGEKMKMPEVNSYEH